MTKREVLKLKAKIFKQTINIAIKEGMSYGRLKWQRESVRFDLEAALYWLCYEYHSGQWSPGYALLSTSPYTPSRLYHSIKDEGEGAEYFYEIMKYYYSSSL
jgi:hypothetical protein